MYIEPTLTRDEFKDIHNALCDLDMLAQSLEEVLRPDKYTKLVKARDTIRKALKNAYVEENRVFKERSDYYEKARDELKVRSLWSIYEVSDLYTEHPFQGAKALLYTDHWGDKPVSVPLMGQRWVDLWIAADNLIRQSGDEHHIFIERFRPLQENNTTLVLQTGS